MQEILIADSGATKSDWCLTRNGEIIHRFSGKGISPVYQTQEEIAEEIRLHVYPLLKEANIEAIYFYGAGCIPRKQAWYAMLFVNRFQLIPCMSTAT